MNFVISFSATAMCLLPFYMILISSTEGRHHSQSYRRARSHYEDYYSERRKPRPHYRDFFNEERKSRDIPRRTPHHHYMNFAEDALRGEALVITQKNLEGNANCS